MGQLKEQSEVLRAKLEAAKELEENIRSELKANEELLKKREDAHGKSICPTCGTSLKGKELDRFHRELLELRDTVKSGKSTFNEAHKNTLHLKEGAKKIEGQYSQEEKAIERDDSRLTTEKRNLEVREKGTKNQEEEAYKQWLLLKGSLNYSAQLISDPTTKCLKMARKQLKANSDIQKRYNRLIQTQADFNAAQVELEKIHGQRQYVVGTFSQSQLDEANNTVTELNDTIKQEEQKLEIKGKEERKLYQLLTKIDNEINTLNERVQYIEQKLIPKEQEIFAESERHQQETLDRFEERLATMDWPVQHLEILRRAVDKDQQAEQRLRRWIDGHRPLAVQLPELKEAEKEIGGLRSRHTILDKQIKGFPQDVQQGKSKIIEKKIRD